MAIVKLLHFQYKNVKRYFYFLSVQRYLICKDIHNLKDMQALKVLTVGMWWYSGYHSKYQPVQTLDIYIFGPDLHNITSLCLSTAFPFII